ncbi:MAG: undecaprenyl-diphosphate phosphatase [Treponema sp.]|nr:undecaprenyl-diphosphate phosphatase [Candidatus Treponema equi]
MTVIQSFLLGLLQGIAEFLPISSSGHLKIAQALFGLEEVPLLFDVILHLATLLAVMIFFRKKIIELLCFKDKKYIVDVIAATFVTGVLGIVVKKLIDDDRLSIKFTCAGLIVTAVILFVSSLVEKKREPVEKKTPSLVQSLFVGLCQGIGTLPGISRSGSTIAGGLFCGLDREVAGEFSFIVSIPAILGAFLLEAKDLGEVTSTVGIVPLVVGFMTAFVSGYFALSVLMKLIKKGRLEWFAFYLVPVGIIGLFMF